MANHRRESGRFEAVDSAGKRYLIIEFTDYIDATTMSSKQVEWVPGLKTLMLSTGGHVNSLGDDLYEIVATGVQIKKSRSVE